MCDKCAELFENSHFRTISVQNEDDSPFASLTTVIAELRTEIKQLANKQDPSVTPITRSRWPLLSQRTQNKRKRDESNEVRIADSCQAGSKPPVGDVVAVPTYSEQQSAKFWLYLSRIQPNVTCEAVSAMAKANLETNDNPVVVKLVPKGRDISTLTFVSFKIGIDETLKSKALDPATWPEGILFREFENFGAQRIQIPTKMPRFLTPSSLSAATPDTPVMNLT